MLFARHASRSAGLLNPSPMKKTPIFLASASLASLVVPSTAAVIYRETFGATTDQTVLTAAGWNGLVGATAAAAVTSQFSLSSAAGRPADLDNVNAGTSASQSQGFVFNSNNTSNILLYTAEYPVDTSLNQITTITFYVGNSGNGAQLAANGFRVALEVGGNWYASDQLLVNSTGVANAAAFGANAQQVTFNFTSTAAAWRSLTVNPGTSLALGPALGADLPSGTITAFGVYSDTGSSQTRRIDTFEINAEAIPEPSAALSTALGALLLTRTRRRS